MFETGWFMDLLIPTNVRIKNGKIFFVGCKATDNKNCKPYCMPCGGVEAVQKLSHDDATVKAFGMLESLVPLNDSMNVKQELDKHLGNNKIKEKYFNTRGKKQHRATLTRVTTDLQTLSDIK
jgi:hypothetical protein